MAEPNQLIHSTHEMGGAKERERKRERESGAARRRLCLVLVVGVALSEGKEQLQPVFPLVLADCIPGPGLAGVVRLLAPFRTR